MNYAFQIRAATKAKAKKAVEAKLAAEGFADDRKRGLAVAAAHIDALPDPGTGEDILVVVNGSTQDEPGDAPSTVAGTDMATASRRLVAVSGACSAYLVAKDTSAVEDQPEALIPSDGHASTIAMLSDLAAAAPSKE